MPFSYVTLAQVRSQLSARLYDPNNVFWTAAELNLYIAEAIQTFNALARYWRGDFVFTVGTTTTGWGEGGYGQGPYGGGTSPSVQWYDLTMQQNTLRPYTVTDVDLYTLMQYQLLEPPTGATWTGTEMYTINDFVNAVQRRRDEILSVTGCTVVKSLIGTTPGTARNPLPDNVLDVRRVAYFPTPASPADTTAVPSVMWPEDVWSFQAFEANYTQYAEGTPNCYAVSTQPPLSFDVDITPDRASQYELLTINAGDALMTTQPTLIPIPTDFAWVLKWGAMADLLSKEAEAKDEARASYCNDRYQQGMKLLMESPALLQFRINNQPLWIDSVRAADEYQTTWEGDPAGTPQAVFLAGLNLIALSPYPDANVYSATATVVQNAPIPVNDADFVQVDRGALDAIIDCAQHIALFKCGGSEFSETKYLYDRFVRVCATYNSKLAESGLFQEEIYGTSQREEAINPRLTKSVMDNYPGGSPNA